MPPAKQTHSAYQALKLSTRPAEVQQRRLMLLLSHFHGYFSAFCYAMSTMPATKGDGTCNQRLQLVQDSEAERREEEHVHRRALASFLWWALAMHVARALTKVQSGLKLVVIKR